MEKIISIIVTYNRLNMLKKILETYNEMEITPTEILIINNNSTDGTLEYLKDWKNKKEKFKKNVLTLKENIGGSGGFYTGMEYVLKNIENYDWVYLADDDAFPEKKLFEKFYKIKKEKQIGVICGSVINKETGEIDLAHRRQIGKDKKEVNSSKEDYQKEYFYLNLFSYVGVFISSKILQKAGNVEKDYFIYYDDTEHSLRINKLTKIICYPNLRIYHDIKKVKRDNNELDWRNYYFTRNKLIMKRKHFGELYFFKEYFYKRFKNFRRYLVGKKNKEQYEMEKCALKDAKLNNLGKHFKYKPGL